MAVELKDQSRLRPNSLGTMGIVFLIIATIAPLGGAISALPLTFGLGTGAGLPLAFVIVGALLIIFTFCYIAMSRHISNAGGFYVYIGNGLGMRAARAAGYIAFVSYNVFQIALWGGFGFSGNVFLRMTFNIEIPSIIWVFAGIALMRILGDFDIGAPAKALGVAVLLGIAAIM